MQDQGKLRNVFGEATELGMGSLDRAKKMLGPFFEGRFLPRPSILSLLPNLPTYKFFLVEDNEF